MSTQSSHRLLGIFLCGVTVSFAAVSASKAQVPPAPAVVQPTDADPYSESAPELEDVELSTRSYYDKFPWMQAGPVPGVEAPYFRDTQFGDHDDYGASGYPGAGYPHQDLRSVRYGVWYRPNDFRGSVDWYEPIRFNPRGVGYPRHCANYRMDYAPAVVDIPYNQYGPYYYRNYQHYNDDQDDKPHNPWWKWWEND